MFNQNHERNFWYLAVDQSYKIVDTIIFFKFINDIFFLENGEFIIIRIHGY